MPSTIESENKVLRWLNGEMVKDGIEETILMAQWCEKRIRVFRAIFSPSIYSIFPSKKIRKKYKEYIGLAKSHN